MRLITRTLARARPWDAAFGAAFAGSLLALGACGPSTPDFPTQPELPDEPRRPDGIAIDKATALPAPAEAADVDEAVVSLRTPLGLDAAVHTVDEAMRSIALEDEQRLTRIFTPDAIALTDHAMAPEDAPNAILWWGHRLEQLDYTELAGETIYRDSELSVFRARHVFEGAPGAPRFGLDRLQDGDVVVRVPILTARVGAVRLLGDEMIFFLRREQDRFRIYLLVEEFQLQ